MMFGLTLKQTQKKSNCYKKDVLDYKFHPFIWDVGGKYVYPTDKAKRQYHYRRGFEDCFEEEPNVPYRSVL